MDEGTRKQLEGLNKFLKKHGDKSREALEGCKVIELKDRLREKFDNMSEPMNQVKYSRNNYDELFPDGKVNTPIGEYKLRSDQYEKLGRKKRKNYLGAMEQTYTDPIAIIDRSKKDKESKLFGKSFSNVLPKGKILISAINHKNKGVTTHDRELNNFLNKIKKPADLIYEKQTGVLAGTPVDDTYSRDLAISDNTQATKTIPQTGPEVNSGDKNKSKKYAQGGYVGGRLM